MPREKKYASDAEKQAAYRERKQEKQFKAQEGFSDRELGRQVRDLYATLDAIRLHLLPPTFKPF